MSTPSSDSENEGYEDIIDVGIIAPSYDSLPAISKPPQTPRNAAVNAAAQHKSPSLRYTSNLPMSPNPGETRPPLPPPNPIRTNSVSDPSLPKIPPKPPVRKPSLKDPEPPPCPTEAIPFDLTSYTMLPEELSLLQLVEKHQDLLPLCVHVCKGFYGSSERFSVSEGDIYNIHFVKKAKVVLVQDCSRVEYRIPINSSVEFGVLYSPEGNLPKALDGYKYPKVSDIMAVSPLPKVVRANMTFKGTAPDNSIEKSELLIIKEIRQKANRRYLMVYSLTTSKVKHLFESCEGHFSTKPYDVRLFLPEILEHVPQPFPMAVYLFVHSDTSEDLPHHLFSSAATLSGESADLSLIASTNCEPETGRPLLVEIPVGLDIEVQVLQAKDETDCDKLYETTNDLLENFDPSKVIQCKQSSDKAATLSTPLQPGIKKGIELVKSTALRHWSSTHIKNSPTLGRATQQAPPVTTPTHIKHSPALGRTNSTQQPPPVAANSGTPQGNNVPALPASNQVTPTHTAFADEDTRSVVSVRADMKRLDLRLSKDFESVKEQLGKLSMTVEQLLVRGMGTDKPVLLGTPPARENAPQRPVSTEVDTLSRQQNLQFMRSLDTANLVQLLDMMGLKQYSQTIAQEHITGDVLLECTEAVLEKELHIESKLHRVRLMKLIDGSHSAQGILSGEGPYGTLSK